MISDLGSILLCMCEGLYNAHKVKVVKMALESLGREDLKQHITDFERVKIFDDEECKEST